jgi:hypothetical protein
LRQDPDSGRFYDGAISELVSGKALQGDGRTQVPTIAALSLGYAAMAARFGYVDEPMRSGQLMREQFFNPCELHPAMPDRCKMLLGGSGDAPRLRVTPGTRPERTRPNAPELTAVRSAVRVRRVSIEFRTNPCIAA